MSRIDSDLLARLRAYQQQPDTDTPPAASLPKGVTYNARLVRYYARRDGRFIGAFIRIEDASAAVSGRLTGLELLAARMR